jgi:hypothetical protein
MFCTLIGLLIGFLCGSPVGGLLIGLGCDFLIGGLCHADPISIFGGIIILAGMIGHYNGHPFESIIIGVVVGLVFNFLTCNA